MKLLLRRKMWEEADSKASTALVKAAQLKDQSLLSALQCLKADASIAVGKFDEAVRSLFAASEFTSTLPERRAEFHISVAAALEHASPLLATAIRARAHAIWEHQGNRVGPLESVLATKMPESTQRNIGRFTRELSDQLRPVAVTNALASAFDLAYSPRLFGAELVDVITTLGCSPQVHILEERDGAMEPVSGWNQHTLLLGTQGTKKLALLCRIPEDTLRSVALADVLRIARAALELERFRQEERNRAALWPESLIEEQAGALFVAEEMQILLATARRIAPTTVPVLITGETGTGKEVLARTIHAYSTRASATFLPFNCSAVPKDMLDSQLFGHRRGAFTGAINSFPGVIRAAAGGTLFLDEIGEATQDIQPKLLRFLEGGEVHPVGEAHPMRADVRVIAATNANLDAFVAQGRFREDLFYRLNIVRLHVPPLRERRVEIPTLAHHYLRKHAQEYGKGDTRLAEETMEYLLLFRWPGNVRQLANEMRRMAALGEAGAVLMPEHLSPEIAASRRTIPASERVLDPTEVVVRIDQPVPAAVQHLERAMIQYALRKCSGNMEETAAFLGLSRKGLYLKRLRYGLEPPAPAASTPDVA